MWIPFAGLQMSTKEAIRRQYGDAVTQDFLGKSSSEYHLQ
jgi:hypothetical protein